MIARELGAGGRGFVVWHELAAKIGRGPNLQAKSPEYERKVRRTVANIEAHEVEDRSALDYLERTGWQPC